MKKLFVILSVIAAFTCCKEPEKVTPDYAKLIIGNWLEKYTPQGSDFSSFGFHYIFSEDGTYSRFCETLPELPILYGTYRIDGKIVIGSFEGWTDKETFEITELTDIKFIAIRTDITGHSERMYCIKVAD